jgi:hypothetical protein
MAVKVLSAGLVAKVIIGFLGSLEAIAIRARRRGR